MKAKNLQLNKFFVWHIVQVLHSSLNDKYIFNLNVMESPFNARSVSNFSRISLHKNDSGKQNARKAQL